MTGPTPSDLRRIDVCNAALMEVGHPARAEWHPTHGAVIGSGIGDPILRRRAAALAVMSDIGPDAVMRCLYCAGAGVDTAPCTPARDVLRDITCRGGAR